MYPLKHSVMSKYYWHVVSLKNCSANKIICLLHVRKMPRKSKNCKIDPTKREDIILAFKYLKREANKKKNKNEKIVVINLDSDLSDSGDSDCESETEK